MTPGEPEALWIPHVRKHARMRLYCFAYAGGGANVFRDWGPALGETIEVCAVQLPGREWRRSELPLSRMSALTDCVIGSLRPEVSRGRPFAFFGYSLGAALAFDLTRRMREEALRLPDKLVLAACRAPQFLPRGPAIYQLDDAAFLAAVRRFGGLPHRILQEPDLLALALPILRADFEALGTYRYEHQAPLTMPVVAYAGSQDPHAIRSEMAAWRNQTTGDFNLRVFPGGHFFINEVREQLLATLTADLATRMPAAGVEQVGRTTEADMQRVSA
jgi:medium-chain acyl-[acyl-carrier-protein] hydrolase